MIKKQAIFLGAFVVVLVATFAFGHGRRVTRAKALLFDIAQGIRYAPLITVSNSSAKLIRGDRRIWVRVKTERLPPGAYTNWFIIFNNPGACNGGCGADDFGNPDVMASGFWATGEIVGDSGKATFRAHAEEGNLPPGGDNVVLFGDGLTDAENAEVHYIIRFHGQASDDPTELERQLTTVDGGCRAFPCYDPQSVVFPLNEH